MRIKRIICIALAIVMVCLSAACVPGNDGVDSGSGGGNSEESGGGSGESAGSNGGGENAGETDNNNGGVSGGDGGGDNVDSNVTDGGDDGGDSDGGETSAPGEGSESGGDGGDSGGAGGSGGSDSGSGSSESGSGESGSGGNGSGGNGGGGETGGGSAGLSGSPADILSKLIDAISSAGVEMPMSLPPTAVTPDLSHNTIGLEENDFTRLVVSASYSLAAIGTFAHQIIMIKANDAASAVEVKKLVSGDGGYDPQKWICVWPEKVIAVESGEFVLIVASYNKVVDAAIAAFKSAAGSIGDVNTIWEFAGE